MPPPSTHYSTRQGNATYDPATLSDDEDASSTTTTTSTTFSGESTVLGYSDGLVPSRSLPDLLDWRVSRIGGAPVFPFSSPEPSSSSSCLSCQQPMPLLTQIYAPLEASALERVVYVFVCPSRRCRGKEGSVRAWRASKLWEEEGQVEQEEEQKAEEKQAGVMGGMGSLIFGGLGSGISTIGAASASANTNPFSTTITTTGASSSNPFVTANPFAPASSAMANPFAPPPPPPKPSPPPAPPCTSSHASPAPAPAAPSSSTVASNPPSSSSSSAPSPPPSQLAPAPTWPTLNTSYPPHWLTTAYEPSSSSSSSSSGKKAAAALAALSLSTSGSGGGDGDGMGDEGGKRREGKGSGGRTKKAGVGGGGGDGWGKEGYEVQRLKGVDEVFLRFQERVEREPEQVVRYNHSSTPLPYSSHSAPYRSLFPSAPESEVGTFSPSRIPACKTCGLPSVFEYQLMPALVGLLNRARAKAEGEGSKKVEGGKKGVMQEDGLDFASVWVFACVGECCDDEGEGVAEGWREERVMVEWEEE